jgi:hypothetical protein
MKVQGAEPAFRGREKVRRVTVDRPTIVCWYAFNYLLVDVVRLVDLGILET